MPPDHVPSETRRHGSRVSSPKPFWTHTGTGTCRRSLIETHTESCLSFASSPKPGVAPPFPSLATLASVIFGALRGPGAKGTLKARPVFTEAKAKQCPPLHEQEGVGGHGRGRVCRAGKVPQPGRGSTSGRPRLGPDPRRVLRPTCGAIRRGWAAAGDVPSALPEPVSTAAARTGAAKVGPPEPSSRGPERRGHRPGSSRDWRRLRHARGGAAAGGGRSRKRKRRSEWGVGPSRSRILGDGECGPRPTAAAAAAAAGDASL